MRAQSTKENNILLAPLLVLLLYIFDYVCATKSSKARRLVFITYCVFKIDNDLLIAWRSNMIVCLSDV